MLKDDYDNESGINLVEEKAQVLRRVAAELVEEPLLFLFSAPDFVSYHKRSEKSICRDLGLW